MVIVGKRRKVMYNKDIDFYPMATSKIGQRLGIEDCVDLSWLAVCF